MTSSLKKLAFSGAIWSFLGYGFGQGMRLISNLFLTRLLFPEVFGLMSLISTFIIGIALFSDIGLTPSVVYSSKGDDPDFLNTAWTIKAIRGVILWIFAVIISFPLAHIYHNWEIVKILPIVGLTFIFDGLASTSTFTLTRQVDVKKNILFDLFFQILQIVIMLIWAWFDHSIWSLVGGWFISSFFKMIASHFLIKNYTNKFTWNKQMAKEILNFGSWIFLSTAATFVSVQADKLILPKLYQDPGEGLKILGVYIIALTFAMIPQDIVGVISGKIIFPIITKFSELPRENLRRKILSKRWMVLLAVGLIVIVLVCFGDILITKLYDKRYHQASWILPILALGVWPNLLYQTGVESLVAVGKPQYLAMSQTAKSIYMFIVPALAFHWFGLVGFIVAVAINDFGLYSTVVYGLMKEKLNFLKQDFSCTFILVVLILIVLTIRNSLGFGYPLDSLFNIH